MSEENARDPFVGMNRFFDDRARSQIPAYYTIGQVMTVSPLVIRAAGMDLDKSDLKIALHLWPGNPEALMKKDWGVRTVLPGTTFYGECRCGLASGTAWVARPQEEVRGALPLAEGDQVLLITNADGQRYYLVDKLVEVET